MASKHLSTDFEKNRKTYL